MTICKIALPFVFLKTPNFRLLGVPLVLASHWAVAGVSVVTGEEVHNTDTFITAPH